MPHMSRLLCVFDALMLIERRIEKFSRIELLQNEPTMKFPLAISIKHREIYHIQYISPTFGRVGDG